MSDYVDVRYEVLDHIVTDIEHLINSKNLSFEEASNKVYFRWNRNFCSRSSLWIGLAFNGPKVIIDKVESLFKKLILKSQLVTMIIIYISSYILENISMNGMEYISEMKPLIDISMVINLICIFYWFFKIQKTNLKTCYSYLFKINLLPTVLIFVLISTIFGVGGNSLNSFRVVILFSSLWSGRQLYKNHMKNISLYSSLNII